MTFGPSCVDLGPELFTACLVVVVLPLGVPVVSMLLAIGRWFCLLQLALSAFSALQSPPSSL